MTGIVVRTVTTKTGTWTVDYDSGTAGTSWGKVSWNSNEPAGTSVTVRVRSSNDTTSWSVWETVTNGVPMSSTRDGRYLQIETTLKITSGGVSPILYDLTVKSFEQPVPEFGSLAAAVAILLVSPAFAYLVVRRRAH